MRRGTIVLLIFLVIAIAIVVVNQLFINQPPYSITIAVDPLAEDWLQAAAGEFNAQDVTLSTGQRALVTLTIINDLPVWLERNYWTNADHPQGWVASSSASLELAQSAGLPLETVVPSLARTPLMWGGFASRANVLTATQNRLDWPLIAEAAAVERWVDLGGESSWGFLKIGYPRPDQTMSGVAVLLASAANYHGTSQLRSEDLRDIDFRNWFSPIINSVQNPTDLGPDLPQQMASRGARSLEFVIAPESQWLLNLSGLTNNEAVRLAYSEYSFVFDFPMAQWDGASMTDVDREAVGLFATFLTGTAQQEAVLAFGLRPADREPTSSARLFTDAQSYGVMLIPDYGEVITDIPSASDIQTLLRWYDGIR